MNIFVVLAIVIIVCITIITIVFIDNYYKDKQFQYNTDKFYNRYFNKDKSREINSN